MGSLSSRRVLHPSLESRFELPARSSAPLPLWTKLFLALALAGPAVFVPSLIRLITSGGSSISEILELTRLTLLSGLWTLGGVMMGPIVLRGQGYPAIVSRRVERSWLRRNAEPLVAQLHPEETVLDVVGVHPTGLTDGAPMVIHVLTSRRLMLFRTQRLWPFGRRLPALRSIPLPAIGHVNVEEAGLLRRFGSLFDAGRGHGLLEVDVLGDRGLALRFPSRVEALLAESRLLEARAKAPRAEAGALQLADLEDDRGGLSVTGSEGDSGALSLPRGPVVPGEPP